MPRLPLALAQGHHLWTYFLSLRECNTNIATPPPQGKSLSQFWRRLHPSAHTHHKQALVLRSTFADHGGEHAEFSGKEVRQLFRVIFKYTQLQMAGRCVTGE
eukprot:scaffold231077_cov30-Tisochrysis_lutea.AAC.1